MKTLHQEALRFKKSVLGEEHVGCADSLYGLARLYWSKGAYDEAELLYQEALGVMEPSRQEALRIKTRRSPCTRRTCGSRSRSSAKSASSSSTDA